MEKMGIIAGTFGFFQFIMPLAGWACVNWIIDIFQSVLPYIPWISLILLLTLGILMVKDGLSGQEEEVCPETDFKCLLIQGLATSMDALSVGFTIASYDGGEGGGGGSHYRHCYILYLSPGHRAGTALRYVAGR
ncbi:manganese efflux pump [uncultured Dialister sp.]|uniref:manganese efflux pump n=1 Tax=uncultured Dialister sp. TaxID=278064 RepID=UPI0034539F6B